jgi:methionine-rich copper-binding protein CopC
MNNRTCRGHWRPILSVFVALTIFQWSSLCAHAHARLVRSTPADKAELARSPAQIEVWFNELLEEKFNSLIIYPAREFSSKTRTNLTDGKPELDPKDRTHLRIKLKLLEPGDYVVEWRVLSRDGHSATGKFTFRIRGKS